MPIRKKARKSVILGRVREAKLEESSPKSRVWFVNDERVKKRQEI